MAWAVLTGLSLLLVLALLALHLRRSEVAAMAEVLAERDAAKARGSHKAQLQYPHIDLSACIGCGACVDACPEDGVLGMVHGQAVVVHGARCVGHGLCAQACPVAAVTVTLEDASERRDIPALSAELESAQVPNLFLAGEVTGYALVRTAIAHGTAVAHEVARRAAAAARPRRDSQPRREPLEQTASEVRHAPQRVLAAHGASTRRGSGDGGTHQERPDEERVRGDSGSARADDSGESDSEVHDVCIVGAGPAGLSCALQSKAHGLDFVVLEQEEIGGTVAKYPRRKLVMTQPVDLPLHGRLQRQSYLKEELIELWQGIARQHALPIHSGQAFTGLECAADGTFTVRTTRGTWRARHVCLALGRRGTPRKLGVPGEDLPKVAYSLLDAQSYVHRRILVVGGGDSAVEAALGLAEQPGNEVTISYRKAAFVRLKPRNEQNVAAALREGRLRAVLDSEVQRIGEHDVQLLVRPERGGPQAQAQAQAQARQETLANDEVFVFAGGTPPFALLEKAGVSFDPADRPPAAPLQEQGTGLRRALLWGLGLSLAVAAWTLLWQQYYGLDPVARTRAPQHGWLRPTGPVGLAAGVLASALILTNLLYVLRRSRLGRFIAGSLQDWMSWHVGTGITALLLVLVHAGMHFRDAPGGHAALGLVVLVVTGAIGRYLYSWIPRAANGRELARDEVKARIAAISGEWDLAGRGFGERAFRAVQELVEGRHWQRSFGKRLWALLSSQRAARTALARLRAEARRDDVPESQVQNILHLARRAHRSALIAAHYEDLRALLASWRWLHRWVALAMVLLAILHVVTALQYGRLW